LDHSEAILAHVHRPAQPNGRLHRTLSSFGVLLLALSCLSPVFSIVGVGGDVLTHAGTGAAGLFLLGIGVAVIWALVYAELGSAYPYAGGDYVGVGSILGSWAGVVTLALWTVTNGPNTALAVQTVSTYVRQLAPGLNPTAVTFTTVAAAVAVALLTVRTSAIITGLFLATEMLVVVVLAGAGLLHPVRGLSDAILHPVTLNAAGMLAPVAMGALALGGIGAAYGTVGGNQAIGFGEELRDPHKKMGNVVLMACMIGAFATAVPCIAVVLGARNLPALLGSPAPFAAFLSQALGGWAGTALSAGVALAIFNAAIATLMFFARLLFSLGRDELLPAACNRFLAGVHAGSGVPRGATLVAGAYVAACCLLTPHFNLIVISGLLVYAWPLLCVAVIVGRRRGLTGQVGYWRSPLFPVAPVLGLVAAAAFVVADLADADAGRPSLAVLGVVVVAAVIWDWRVLRRRAGGWAPRLGE
jgi:amino acid transporter